MKIKPILFAIITASVITTTNVKANPIGLVCDVLTAIDNNIGPRAVLYGNSRPTIVTSYQEQPYSRGYCERGDTFHKPVTYFDGYEYSKGAPPPEAYKKVVYPGPAPKYLYEDRSIKVHDRGDHHIVTYRRPGW